ncbi:conserved protein of unknown function [Ectopseudomonas oleovorans]|uniref:Uncharacterized protein n=1 Tax=Ectopseudomonas oleovorans TaxID=301 RepID=A0A653AYX6_ECTOL|nr:conserved protein of unknown function [Pseudomonas oleovorans]
MDDYMYRQAQNWRPFGTKPIDVVTPVWLNAKPNQGLAALLRMASGGAGECVYVWRLNAFSR